MLAKRIIPCLDTVNGRVVKGVNFVDLKDVGDPVEIAKKYEEQGADEIVILDINATNENRETRFALVERASKGLSVPMALGGGIRSLDDIRKALGSGAAKASINSAAVKNPELIREAAQAFGKSRIVVAIDGKQTDGGYKVMVNGGQTNTGLDLVEWAKQCEELGAGEILLTSMDADGVQNGYDIGMTKAVVDAVEIPVIASGGCGTVAHILEVFKKTGCDAALAASLLHFGNATVDGIKAEMERNGIPCRR
ncbi:MAG: imidazole glycerol phosphate synthase subunit HisF [Firmicutes bacterium]|nr:imidazole glycerol phosphate synthase subunit HisF [Bacillota bacterium]